MTANDAVPLTRDWLLGHPLPQPSADGDKDERGRVLIVAGAGEMPGAAVLSAVAALRAGAGKLQIATPASAAPMVAGTVPEARVVSLPENRSGALSSSALDRLGSLGERADAIVVGPGLLEGTSTARMLAQWLVALPAVPVVIDAAALSALEHQSDAIAAAPVLRILTPHAGEAAKMLACERSDVIARPVELGIELARRFNAVCVMKGGTGYVIDGPSLDADAAGSLLVNRYGNVGLATSGSGDLLSGIVGGLAARGASPFLATAWGVYLHAAAGDALAERFGGPLGFLARELLDEVPALMNALTPPRAE
ncbi:NAD(P)H-hydrate dehydratase [Cognatilysobacter bugurensis]|uniref:ADP-dependent (S)-NAD(P)H-hydrate dehydratase n=1 Tax=Cognatilysobacter bugurensis TaxID=543356 RepID=A0A918T1B9_9GAMM|nr:NAD(P)H-hydrate dehydratase [Lysobacter bugurensis]GHA80389.1 ADP-dependent (S)-NAD(P)H-hydrate dehydratase [Lysobacter bugurensis]